MDQARTTRAPRLQPGRVPPGGESPRPAAAAVMEPGDIQDLLGSITDRVDLERLYDRHVALPDILRLMGHQISREEIHELLESPDLEDRLRKLL